ELRWRHPGSFLLLRRRLLLGVSRPRIGRARAAEPTEEPADQQQSRGEVEHRADRDPYPPIRVRLLFCRPTSHHARRRRQIIRVLREGIVRLLGPPKRAGNDLTRGVAVGAVMVGEWLDHRLERSRRRHGIGTLILLEYHRRTAGPRRGLARQRDSD